ncbi:MAG: hypothetical protein HY778_06245 [Betaproteobacteria bacterium]|nr:hypothetical protein [Betaproteobacteria bacterium]
MKRTMLVAAALVLLPAGVALAAPTSACPGAWLLAQADDPHSCFKTGSVTDDHALAQRGAAGQVKRELAQTARARQEVPIEIRHSHGDPGWYGAQ